ncbi:MAG: hypothetical protein VYD57_19075 [Pseudomonadota bacterium]|nr:hypothetical protein [Pseudomonadota bacterium]
MTVLIAGFAPFPGAPFNPSADLVAALRQAPQRPGRAVVTLPVSWDDSWPVLQAAIEESGARGVILFGLHMSAERLRIELLARNRRELGREDAVGRFPAGPSILEGPATHACRLPLSDLARLLRRHRLDFEWSTNAGGYLCNDTLYKLAHHADRLGIEAFGFIHLPLSDERVGDMMASGEEVPAVFNSVSADALLGLADDLFALLSVEAPAKA